MLRIEIKSLNIAEQSGIAKSGKPYSIRKQTGWAYTYDNMGDLNPFPERIEISLADKQAAYPVGQYTLADRTFYVGDYSSLTIGRLILDPISAPLKPAL
jgi:Helix-destabilising protein